MLNIARGRNLCSLVSFSCRPYTITPTLQHPAVATHSQSNLTTHTYTQQITDRTPAFLEPTISAQLYQQQKLHTKMPSSERQGFGPVYRRQSSCNRPPFMIGVAGGTASGKSSVCKLIMDQLGQNEVNNIHKQVVSLSQDSFYRELNPQEILLANKGKFNFDHPDAFDNELMENCLAEILAGRSAKIPVYDFKTNSRVPGEFTTIYPSDVVLVEGILVFYYPKMREMFGMKLFVDTDADTRLARRVLRDIEERGRGLEHILTQYTTLGK